MVKRSVVLIFSSIIVVTFVAYSIIPRSDPQTPDVIDIPQNYSQLSEQPLRPDIQPPDAVDVPQNESQSQLSEPVPRPEVKIPSPLEVVKLGVHQYAGATGRTYFFDASSGNDGNDGLSEETPLRSIGKLNSMTFNPGDHIYFKRGQTWSGTKLEVPSSGSAKYPIVFGSYGEGEFPIITVEGTDQDTAFLIAGRDYVIVREVDLRGGLMASLSVYGSSYSLIEDCRIGRGSMSMGVWVSDKPWAPKKRSSDYGEIRNCVIDSGYSKRNGTTEDGIHLRINASRWTIHNVYLSGWGHSMVSLWQQGGNGSVSYNKVFQSYFTSGNVTYTRAFDIKGEDRGAQFNEFYGNWIVNVSVRSQIGGDHNLIYENIFHTIKNSPDKDFGTAQGIYLTNSMVNSSYVSHDNIISNNTFIDCDEPAIFVRSIESYWPTYGNVIKNNTIYNCGSNSKEGYGNVGLFIANQTGVYNNSYVQNIFLYPAGSMPILYGDLQLSVQDFNEADRNGDAILGNARKPD